MNRGKFQVKNSADWGNNKSGKDGTENDSIFDEQFWFAI